MKSADIRETFLKFFESAGHTRVRSSSLIPAADPTLLFTNAGMVQFKDHFLGLKDLTYTRATTCQKCVRAGGKHNDLENVGVTPRHHTFFEMLGNFSFGDYFKKDAVAFAWELVTQRLAIPADRLWITVFETDDEAFKLWKAIGVPTSRIERLGEKDNFWAMGDTGPCGPCTEIHFDWGKKPGSGDTPGTDPTGRFLEIWNLVFMQFDRSADGKKVPLPKPSVDTGAGLERMSCVLQGVFSNYDTDLFKPILQSISSRVGTAYEPESPAGVSMRVIADHLRSGALLIGDGVTPSNEGRGYVLRRILRRAIRHGKRLGQEKPFIYELLPSLIQTLGSVYPELVSDKARIQTEIQEEETRFHETLHRGMGYLDEAIHRTKRAGKTQLSPEDCFRLYDTFGFPLDLVQTILSDHSLHVDEAGFDALMEGQRSQSVWAKGDQGALDVISKNLPPASEQTRFTGYKTTRGQGKLVRLYGSNGSQVSSLANGTKGFAILDTTPFYAESGGQVGDTGKFLWPSGSGLVTGTRKAGAHTLHEISVPHGTLKEGQELQLEVNETERAKTAVNHTATHLLHAALRQVLGTRVRQAGSLVTPEKLRFDFTHSKPLDVQEVATIEKIVNDEIRKGHAVSIQELPYQKAIEQGALAFFDEKYGDTVRVIRVGTGEEAFSVELCGGTHLDQIGRIGIFKIISESSVSSGVRRIEAITAEAAFHHLSSRDRELQLLEAALGGRSAMDRVRQMQGDLKALERERDKLQLAVASQGAGKSTGQKAQGGLWDSPEHIGNYKVVTAELESLPPKVLRELVDQGRDKLGEKTVIALASVTDGKLSLCLGISRDLVDTLHAGKLVQPMASELGGSGGGKPDFAQAGGPHVENVKNAFKILKSSLEK